MESCTFFWMPFGLFFVLFNTLPILWYLSTQCHECFFFFFPYFSFFPSYCFSLFRMTVCKPCVLFVCKSGNIYFCLNLNPIPATNNKTQQKCCIWSQYYIFMQPNPIPYSVALCCFYMALMVNVSSQSPENSNAYWVHLYIGYNAINISLIDVKMWICAAP